MKKSNILISSSAVIVLIAIFFITAKMIKKDYLKEKTERNFGVSHVETKITSNGVESTDPEEAVPQREELLKNLENKGYEIKYYDTVFDSSISCYRIYAMKNNEFIDICYGLSEENAEQAFKEFEKKYDKYYLMAMNGTYVYCISDKIVFNDAGFKSLANNGIQYINH